MCVARSSGVTMVAKGCERTIARATSTSSTRKASLILTWARLGGPGRLRKKPWQRTTRSGRATGATAGRHGDVVVARRTESGTASSSQAAPPATEFDPTIVRALIAIVSDGIEHVPVPTLEAA